MMSNKTSTEMIDELMQEIKSMREEFTLQMGKYEEINELSDEVQDLKKRVQKLEHPALWKILAEQ